MVDPAVPVNIECELVADVMPRPLQINLKLPAGATVSDAVDAACEAWGEAGEACRQLAVGIWGEVVQSTRPLRSGDRVELYRQLPNDPRAARRARASGVRGQSRSSR